MPEKVVAVPRSEITYKGTFNYEWLYKNMHFWLGKNGYKDVQGDGDKIESFFFENIWSGGKLKELWYWWRTKKTDSDNFTFYINIDVHLLGHGKKEIIVDGTKLKTHEQEMSLFIESYVMVGEQFDLTKNWFTQLFWFRYKNEIHNDRIEQKKDDLYSKTHELINVVKQYLEEMQHKSVPPPFHNPGGIPQLK